MKKRMSGLFLLLLAVCGTATLSSCATAAAPKSEKAKDFKRATLGIANQVADSLKYDRKWADSYSAAKTFCV